MKKKKGTIVGGMTRPRYLRTDIISSKHDFMLKRRAGNFHDNERNCELFFS